MNVVIAPNEPSAPSSYRPFELPAHEIQDLRLAPPIDRNQLVEQCVGNLDFALMMLDEFEMTSESRLNEFDVALAAGNLIAIKHKAHALKGVAGIFAARTMFELCSKLESSAEESDWTQTIELVQQLHQEMQRTIDFIPNIRAQT